MPDRCVMVEERELGGAQQEFSVTDEMLRAGVDEFSTYDDRFETAEDAVLRVYMAMERIRKLTRTGKSP